ncbi:uncharacterized protein E0L32_011783 [Thyridium curvatum]|uniref:Uncharacterized protein n=1 Tax=Thyridium curvatum TaxID=1093900 RepID=A0A507BHW8_9PEZI|nr:uncharacterized protein E0L32_011783 [Thyridium curvatum]TPX18334.1 hypothetical protein E0L32_011783 [Thyridium curvatum]
MASPSPLLPGGPGASPKSAKPAGAAASAAISTARQTHLPTADVEESPIAAADAGAVPEDELEMASTEDGTLSASTSITSSIHQHAFENGRRFHSYKYGRYPIPNDDAEQRREDVKHAMMLELTDGKLWHAPLPADARRILDVGTGTGIWAIEAADQLPGAEVLGVDLSPIQPKWVPSNCRFLVDDVEEEWLYGDNFDMVHMRTMASVLKDIPKVLRRAYNALKPGGWLGMQELQAVLGCDDGTTPPNDGLAVFYRAVRTSLTKFGMDLDMPRELRPLLEEAGFVAVAHVARKVPVGPWAADRSLRVAGLYCREAVGDLVPAMAAKPFRAAGLSGAECEALAAGARAALGDMSRHRYLPFHFWTAQRPLVGG